MKDTSRRYRREIEDCEGSKVGTGEPVREEGNGGGGYNSAFENVVCGKNQADWWKSS